MSVNIGNTSRLRFANLILRDGIEFFDLISYPAIVPQLDDILYTVMDSDRIDLLANTYYGDPQLWWVIALANDIELLPTDFNVGVVIKIPSPTWVKTTLFKKALVK